MTWIKTSKQVSLENLNLKYIFWADWNRLIIIVPPPEAILVRMAKDWSCSMYQSNSCVSHVLISTQYPMFPWRNVPLSPRSLSPLTFIIERFRPLFSLMMSQARSYSQAQMSSEDKESQPFNIGFKQIPMTRPSLLRSENLLTAQHIMRAHSPHMLALSHWRVESVTMSPCHH